MLSAESAKEAVTTTFRTLPAVPSPELFHGASGIGYELLRYAKPDTIVPLIF